MHSLTQVSPIRTSVAVLVEGSTGGRGEQGASQVPMMRDPTLSCTMFLNAAVPWLEVTRDTVKCAESNDSHLSGIDFLSLILIL